MVVADLSDAGQETADLIAKETGDKGRAVFVKTNVAKARPC